MQFLLCFVGVYLLYKTFRFFFFTAPGLTIVGAILFMLFIVRPIVVATGHRDGYAQTVEASTIPIADDSPHHEVPRTDTWVQFVDLLVKSSFRRSFDARLAVCQLVGPIQRIDGSERGEQKVIATMHADPNGDPELPATEYAWLGVGAPAPDEHQIVYILDDQSIHVSEFETMTWCHVGENWAGLADAASADLTAAGANMDEFGNLTGTTSEQILPITQEVPQFQD